MAVEECEFLVEGSAPDPYRVTFHREDGQLTASCTCPAGERQMHCKHRIRILRGSAEGIVSGNGADVSRVVGWLKGSKLQEALGEFLQSEAAVEEANRRLAGAKHKLARIMAG